jgi:hypothetical protein
LSSSVSPAMSAEAMELTAAGSIGRLSHPPAHHLASFVVELDRDFLAEVTQ